MGYGPFVGPLPLGSMPFSFMVFLGAARFLGVAFAALGGKLGGRLGGKSLSYFISTLSTLSFCYAIC